VTAWSVGDDDLGSILDKIRNDLDDLAGAVEFLPERLKDIDGHVDAMRRSVRQLEAQAADADSSVRELGALVKRLDARVEWLERNIRLHDPSAVVVELDDVPPDVIQLAEIAERGHVAQSNLLTAAARSGLEAAVEAHADAVRGHAQHLDVALSACRTIADTAIGEEVHVEAIGEFRASVTAMDDARRRSKELAREAVEAAERLGVDEELRRAPAHVSEGALLPAWFTTVLGPIPPAEDTRAWMDAATGLLAYRVTYAVTDPIVALGAEPSDRHSQRRRAWHQQLKRMLRDLQR
jgi:hypothetical protein